MAAAAQREREEYPEMLGVAVRAAVHGDSGMGLPTVARAPNAGPALPCPMAFERKLVSLHVSPWSERAKWALDHHRLAYTVVEHVPIAGERRLRLHPTCPVEERGRTVKI